MTSTSDLSTPLLGNEQDSGYDEECCMRSPASIVYDDSEEDEDDEQSRPAFLFDNYAAWFVLPFLLFMQFGMAFYMTNVEATTGLRWSVVNYSITLFVIVSILYRQAVKDCKISFCAVHLLPEILMDIILGLVLFDKVVPAFLFMLSGMLWLSVIGVMCNIRVLVGMTTFSNSDSVSNSDKTILV
jgi:hypothetical protein